MCPYLQGIDAGAVEGYQEKGVDRLVLLCLAFDVDMLKSQLDMLATTVLEPSRP